MVPDERTGGPHFAAYAERYLRHTKGRWAGQPLRLEPWQRDFWWEALEIDPATGLRIYTEVGLGLPRKNGKSTLASSAGLYMLDADGEPEPEVYAAAAARAQAGIVMGQSIRMVKASPMLMDRLVPRRYYVECPRNGGIMRSLSADAPLQHGLNPHCNIIDELHAHRDDSLYTALTTGTGAREQPFTLWITTAGVAGEGILARLVESMLEGSGELEDRGALRIYRDRKAGVLIWWYGVPPDADVEDPAVYLSVNPASWLQDGHEMARTLARLKSRGALLEWRRYHCNQFVGLEASWLPDGAWDRLPRDLDLDPALPVGVGIDKGQTSDFSAINVCQKQGDIIVTRSTVFTPEQATGRVNSEAMRVHLRQLFARFPKPMSADAATGRPLPGPAFAFDRWSFGESAEILEGEGLNMVDFPQISSRLGPASTRAYELVATGRVHHDGDPVLAEHIRNSSATLTDQGMKIAKAGKRPGVRKNDAAVAFVMASWMATQDPPKPSARRVYGGF